MDLLKAILRKVGSIDYNLKDMDFDDKSILLEDIREIEKITNSTLTLEIIVPDKSEVKE